MYQTTLPFHFDEPGLRAWFEIASNRKISLFITDNSTSLLSIKEKKGVVNIRLHRMFLCAGSDVLNEIADYIKRGRKKTPLIRDFINRHAHSLKKGPPRKIRLITRGRHHDLQDIHDLINREYFGGNLSVSITWGPRGAKRPAAKRTLGSYSCHSNTIRINPALDSKSVPRYFMEFLIYHEMLHADIGIKYRKARRTIHSAEFKKREKLFRHYERAVEWEKKSLLLYIKKAARWGSDCL